MHQGLVTLNVVAQDGMRAVQDRLDQALVELEKLQAQKEKKKKGSGKKARCSSTDPEARKMTVFN